MGASAADPDPVTIRTAFVTHRTDGPKPLILAADGPATPPLGSGDGAESAMTGWGRG